MRPAFHPILRQALVYHAALYRRQFVYTRAMQPHPVMNLFDSFQPVLQATPAMTVVVVLHCYLPSTGQSQTQADDSSSAAEPPPACLSAIPAGFQGFLPAFLYPLLPPLPHPYIPA